MTKLVHPWPLGLDRAAVDRVIVCVSDTEMGAGGVTDDFPQSTFLGELLLRYNEPPFAEVPLTIVFNGDTFDLLKTPYEGSYPVHITEAIALAKLESVLAAHEGFVSRIRRFLEHPVAPREICFVVGNHDAELVFEGVQARLTSAFGGRGIVHAGLRYEVADVSIEHGSQHDPLFQVDEQQLFVEHQGETLLNLPWGTVALLEVLMPLWHGLYRLDRLKPRPRVLEAVPEVKELLIDSFFRYWTRDFPQGFLATDDPLHRLSWPMIRQVVYRFSTGDPRVSGSDMGRLLAKKATEPRLFLRGHVHEPGWANDGDRRVLQTGCFRNEFALDPERSSPTPLPAVYAEVYIGGGRTVRSHLVEVHTPRPPEDTIPTAPSELPELRRLLAEDGERIATREERAARERAEAHHEEEGGPSRFLRTLRQIIQWRGDDGA